VSPISQHSGLLCLLFVLHYDEICNLARAQSRHLRDVDVYDYIVLDHLVTWGRLLLRSDSLIYRDDRGYVSIQPRSKQNLPARLEPHTGSRNSLRLTLIIFVVAPGQYYRHGVVV
jgi:hypothetical protein